MKYHSFAVFIKKVFENRIHGSVLLSVILTLLYRYGNYLLYEEQFMPILVLKYLLVFVVYLFLIYLIYYFLTAKIGTQTIERLVSFLDRKHSRLYVFLFFLIVWFPHLIIKYPVGNHIDSYYELMQGLGFQTLTSHWPVFYTLFLTWFYKFGESIGSRNFGMFLCAVFKEIVQAYFLSHVVISLRKHRISNLILVVSIVFYAFCPIVAGYIGTTLKDADYSVFTTLMSSVLLAYLCEKEEFWNSRENISMLLISSFFIVLLRNNGIYLVSVCLFFMAVWECKRKEYGKILVLLVAIILPVLCSNLINVIYKPVKGSVAEALPMPIQQVARLVSEKPELITDEEKEIINAVLPYDEIGEKYRWYLADPVKDMWNKDASLSDTLQFLGVWFKCFFRSPLTYFEATISQNIYLLHPGINNFRYYIECNNYQVEKQEDGLLQSPDWIKEKQGLYESFMYIQHELPVLRLLNNTASFNVLFLFSILYILNRKELKKLLVFLPAVVTFAFCVIGPAIITNARYCFPIVWAFPIWLGVIDLGTNQFNR